MFEVLIREAETRFGLQGKALQLVQMLLAYMTDKDTGGLAGFLEKFKAADLGPIVQSWLGGGPSAQPISNEQLERVLGSSDGLIGRLSSNLGAGRQNVTSALGYLIPALVGKLTPGGNLPRAIPAEISSLAIVGRQLLDGPAAAVPHRDSSGAPWGKWLPWIVVAILVLLAIIYWNRSMRAGDGAAVSGTPAPAAAVQSGPVTDQRADAGSQSGTEPDAADATGASPAPAQQAPTEGAGASDGANGAAATNEADPLSGAEGAADTGASNADASPSASPTEAAAGSAAGAGSAGAAAPLGPEVVAHRVDGAPALNVYFASGRAEVAADFADKAEDLVAYLGAHPDMQAVVVGYTDATGNSEMNAKLSKERAQAVQAALLLGGVDESRIVLEKPAQVEEASSASDAAASRRVEVTVRKASPDI